MKPDDFETALSRIPLRPPPPGWREDILSAARATVEPRPATTPTHPLATPASTPSPLGWLAAFVRRFPSVPLPWSGLAVTAAVCLALQSTAAWLAPHPQLPEAAAPSLPATEWAQALRAHQSQILALIESEDEDPEAPSALPVPAPSTTPKPRSEWRLPERSSPPTSPPRHV